MLPVKHKHIATILLGMTLTVIACTPTARHGVLNTLFDGVPPQTNNSELIVGLDTLGQVDSTRIIAIAAATNFSKTIYHEPYQQKDCSSCHNQQRMGELVAEEPELCYQCHNSDNERHSVKHGPAGAGYCTACHRPHMAEERNLLLANGNNLCFTCHDNEQVTQSVIHQDLKKRDNCIDCHNPHSSENIFLLQDGACNNCHEEKANDYSFLHGPVSGNYCSTCHETHASKNKNLLRLPGQDLCLNCHSSTTIFINPEHQGDDKANCTACHNPHGGENQFMLK